jgi:RHS repeat-associated protein
MGLGGALLKLELLVNGEVAGIIAENLPGMQTSYQWQVGKTLTGTVNPGSDYKVRVTAVVPPAASGTTYYFYDSGGKLLSEYDGTGVCVKDYLYLGGKMIGEYVPTTSSYYYYASDQINSTRMVTDAAGAVVHSAQYDPYGGLYKTWVDTYHPKPGFSGKEREFGSEMDYFGARYYGHRQYRFLSIDPIIKKNESLINPQLWNLYSYCGNNPIGFIDPDGNILRTIEINTMMEIAGPARSRISISNGTLNVSNLTQADISNNTGARLLFKIATSPFVISYTEGATISTWSGSKNIDVANLDNVFDSRFDRFDVNKPLSYIPKNGTDCAIGINPNIRWIGTPRAAVAFHELVEGYFRVTTGMPYETAHRLAASAERMLNSERNSEFSRNLAGESPVREQN